MRRERGSGLLELEPLRQVPVVELDIFDQVRDQAIASDLLNLVACLQFADRLRFRDCHRLAFLVSVVVSIADL